MASPQIVQLSDSLRRPRPGTRVCRNENCRADECICRCLKSAHLEQLPWLDQLALLTSPTLFLPPGRSPGRPNPETKKRTPNSTLSSLMLKETLLVPKTTFAPNEKHIDLKHCKIGSAGAPAKLVGNESGVIHKLHDLGKERRTVVKRNSCRLKNYHLRSAEYFTGAL